MAIVSVIKYDGGPDIFAWKYPSEEIGTWSQLIVNESQEVILYKGGQALDLFTSGRHTLETSNIPVLSKIVNLPFGGRSPFTAEVWFINKVNSLDVKWGTASPIQLQDTKYKVFIPVRSFGQFGIQINDSRKFMIKLMGTVPVFDKDNLTKYFRGLYLTKVKDAISTYLIKKQITVLEINAYLDELSEHLKERILPVFEEYGISLVNFFINDINVPEDDSAVKTLKDALAKKAEMDIIGYNYVQQRSFDTLEGAATNKGSGQAGLMDAGIGLGMGVSLGGGFGQQFGGIAQNINIRDMKKCTKCNTDMEKDKRFCGNCGFDTNSQETKDNNMTTCNNCGTIFSKNSKFCPECGDTYEPCIYCGADLNKGDSVCKVCGKEVPKPCNKCGTKIENLNTKFCPECGESLIKKCSGCGATIQGSPKFCPECGNKI